MSRFQVLFAIFLLLPSLAAGQTDNQIPVDTGKPAQDSLDRPPVLLRPMQQNSGINLSLIDDVCRQTRRQTRVYRFQNSAVADVAETINQWLQQKLKSKQAKVNGFICNAPIIIVPEVESNTLVISTTDAFTLHDELEQLIQKLDRESATIQIKAVIKRTVDGKTQILAAPSMIVRENTTGSITVGNEDDQLTLELTARVTETEPVANARSAEKQVEVDSK